MGYEVEMQRDLLALLKLFESEVLDPESHASVTAVVGDSDRWGEAHDVFDGVRNRYLGSDDRSALKTQYAFEE